MEKNSRKESIHGFSDTPYTPVGKYEMNSLKLFDKRKILPHLTGRRIYESSKSKTNNDEETLNEGKSTASPGLISILL